MVYWSWLMLVVRTDCQICKNFAVDILLLAQNRPWWEYLMKIDKYWKLDFPPHPGPLLNIFWHNSDYTYYQSYISVFLVSIFLTAFIVDLILPQYKFSEQRSSETGEGKVKVTRIQWWALFLNDVPNFPKWCSWCS